MLKLLQFANLKKTLVEDPAAVFYIITPGLKYTRFIQIQECPVLYPNEKISRDFRLGELSRTEMKDKYAHGLQSPIVRELLRYLRSESKDRDIYLVEHYEEQPLLSLDMLDNIK